MAYMAVKRPGRPESGEYYPSATNWSRASAKKRPPWGRMPPGGKALIGKFQERLGIVSGDSAFGKLTQPLDLIPERSNEALGPNDFGLGRNV